MKNKVNKLFHQADGIVILAGAGMSVDSGLPDFRGKSGIWTEAKENFTKYSTAAALDQDPVVAWNFYIDRIIRYRNTVPHSGYTALLNAIKMHNKDYFVVTSNIDGHFQKSGYNPDLISEIHGDLQHTQCNKPCSRTITNMSRFECIATSVDDLPKCTNCGSILRPHVMMFSDPKFIFTNVDYGEHRYREWSSNKLSILGIELGAGTTIPSIRYFGEEHTTALIRINPYESSVNRPQDVGIAETAKTGIEKIVGWI